MFNLAALRYRNILAQRGGPIQVINRAQVKLPTGQIAFEASARLNPNLTPKHEIYQIYDNVDGSGTDLSKSVAIHKAISECLERWAFWTLRESPEASIYGFDIDPSTSGMAAFPGLTLGPVRTAAKFEALERWGLQAWWADLLPAKELSTGHFKSIEIPILPEGTLVIVWKTVDNDSTKVAYGFAAGKNSERALKQAVVEMGRNQLVLSRVQSDMTSWESLITAERRLLWFASSEGHHEFLSKVRSSTSFTKTSARPVVHLSTKIDGPWSPYATVWRHLYKPLRTTNNGSAKSQFLF